MDFSLTTDFSGLLNWDDDEVNNAVQSAIAPNNNHHLHCNAQEEKPSMIATSSLADIVLQHPQTHSQQQLQQQQQQCCSQSVNQNSGETSVGQVKFGESTKQTGSGAAAGYQIIPNNQVLNGFVTATALADKPSSDLLKSKHQNVLNSAIQAPSLAGGVSGVGGPVPNVSKLSSSSILSDPLQQQHNIPQHLQLDFMSTGGSLNSPRLANQFWHLQESSNHNSGGTMNAPSANNTIAPPQIEHIYPPNYFLPGMGSWDPSQAFPNSSVVNKTATRTTLGNESSGRIGEGSSITSTTTSTSTATSKTTSTFSDETAISSQTTASTALPSSAMTNSAFLSLQQPHNQLGFQGRGSTVSWGQQSAQNPSLAGIINNNPAGNQTTNTAVGQSMPQSLTPPNSAVTAIRSLPVGVTNSIDNRGVEQQQHSQLSNQQFMTSNINTSASLHDGDAGKEQRKRQRRKSKTSSSKKARRGNSSSRQSQQPGETPPFYLFDAPCELRTNFIQAQTLNNIAVVPDCNSYHYGAVMNGFPSQSNAQPNPSNLPASSDGTTNHQQTNGHFQATTATAPSTAPPILLDGRQKNKSKTGNERNEREQQRAQKITELIDKLKTTMESDGWNKNEMKSKYQVLSTCAAYITYLKEEEKKKKAAVEKAQNGLAIRLRKFEEKSQKDSRSDPESVISCLTTSSAEGGIVVSSSSRGLSADSNDNEKKEQEDGVVVDENVPRAGRQRLDDCGSGLDSSSSCNQERSTRRPGVKNISVDKMSSSVSEMTESKRSAEGSNGSGGTSDDEKADSSSGSESPPAKKAKERSDSDIFNVNNDNISEPSSISSTAAVVSGIGSRERDHPHADVVIKDCGVKEKTSLESDFQLNYEEVFLSSNIPQLIATQTGRIAICNDFFYRATGLTEDDIQRITIFSMIQHDKLPILFELVATSLRRSNSPSSSDVVVSDESADSTSKRGTFTGYKTVTLPCVPFPKGLTSSAGDEGEKSLHPLFITVTLMADDNPKNRCMHCLLSGSAGGSDGKIAPITPYILRKMFSDDSLDLAEELPQGLGVDVDMREITVETTEE